MNQFTNFETIKFWTDTETTGFSEDDDQILSYSAIIENQKAINICEYEKQIFLKPSIMPNVDALLVNNLNPFSLDYQKNAINELNAIYDIIEISKKGRVIIIAYNAEFDKGMYTSLFKRYGKNFSKYFKTILDPLLIAKKLINQNILHTVEILKGKDNSYKSSKLEDVFIALGHSLDNINTHSALDDTKMLQTVGHAVFYLATKRQLADINCNPNLLTEGDCFSLILLDENDGVKIVQYEIIKNFIEKECFLGKNTNGNYEIISHNDIIDIYISNEDEKIYQIIKNNLINQSEVMKKISLIENKNPDEFNEVDLEKLKSITISSEEFLQLTEEQRNICINLHDMCNEKLSYNEKVKGLESAVKDDIIDINGQFNVFLIKNGQYKVKINNEEYLFSKKTEIDNFIKKNYISQTQSYNIDLDEYLGYKIVPIGDKFEVINILKNKSNKSLLDINELKVFFDKLEKEEKEKEIKSILKNIPNIKNLIIKKHPLFLMESFNKIEAEVFMGNHQKHKDILSGLLSYYTLHYPTYFSNKKIPTFKLNLSFFKK